MENFYIIGNLYKPIITEVNVRIIATFKNKKDCIYGESSTGLNPKKDCIMVVLLNYSTYVVVGKDYNIFCVLYKNKIIYLSSEDYIELIGVKR